MSLVLDGTNGVTMPVGSQSNASIVAWANMNGTSGASPIIRASYNITSITRNSTGNYTVVMTNAALDANYAVVISSGDGSQVTNIDVNYTSSGTLTAPTTTTFIFATSLVGTGARDQTYINFAVFR
jgi:hypothetical protein